MALVSCTLTEPATTSLDVYYAKSDRESSSMELHGPARKWKLDPHHVDRYLSSLLDDVNDDEVDFAVQARDK